MGKTIGEQHLLEIIEYFEEAQDAAAMDTSELIASKKDIHILERTFQLLVDATIDLNTFIIRSKQFGMPDDNWSSFEILWENNIISTDLGTRIAPTVGVRNAIVHRYGKQDKRKMIEDVKKSLPFYREYIKQIEKTIKTLK